MATKWLPVYDEDGYMMEFVYRYLDGPYGLVKWVCSKRVVRFCIWNNHMTPYENLETGVLYDSLGYLCYKSFPEAFC